MTDSLPAVYRQVVRLHHLKGLTFPEVGKVTGRSPAAARMLWCRALERLANLLRRDHAS